MIERESKQECVNDAFVCACADPCVHTQCEPMCIYICIGMYMYIYAYIYV